MTYINNLDIRFFRGISSLRLENLSQINILTGDNNCGKTSVLEVLKSYDHPESLKTWGGLLRRDRSTSLYSLYEGFYDLFNINAEDKRIEYEVNVQEHPESNPSIENIQVCAGIAKEDLTESEYMKIRGLRLLEDESQDCIYTVRKMEIRVVINGEKISEGNIYERQRMIGLDKKAALSKSKGNVVYISPFSHLGADVYLTDILKYPELYEEMLEILKDYDENIISINYDNDDNYPGNGIYKILSKSYKEALPLNVYGDEKGNSFDERCLKSTERNFIIG